MHKCTKYKCKTSLTVESGHELLEIVEVEHELMVTMVVIMYGDVVAIGADNVGKLLSTNGLKTISRSYIFLAWMVSYTYLQCHICI